MTNRNYYRVVFSTHSYVEMDDYDEAYVAEFFSSPADRGDVWKEVCDFLNMSEYAYAYIYDEDDRPWCLAEKISKDPGNEVVKVTGFVGQEFPT